MRRRDLDYLVIAGMLISGAYTAVSGLVADLFGFPQFFLHPFAGYTCAALALVHVALNWARTRAYLTRLGRSRSRKPDRSEPTRNRPVGRREFVVGVLAGLVGFLLGRAGPSAADYAKGDLGLAYHEWSKPGASDLVGAIVDWGPRPQTYKTYPEAPQIALPDPEREWGMDVARTIRTRRSRREYAGAPLPLSALSQLLFAAQSITEPRRGFRAAPSAGALYPIEIYPVVHNLEDLEPGVYHYAVADHGLEQLRTGDLRAAMTTAGIGQQMLGQAQVCFVLSAIFQRTRWRYRERTYRYVMLEAGHIGQNIYLAATALGLGACAVGAFLDGKLNNILKLDGEEEAAVYVISVGRLGEE
jgi:SagB-type dehydrogenase family enzyme